ncbi:MAG: hypothetical protein ACI9XO_002622 [Paraglaciecola sp.]|jgi:hypothetical protein
MKSNFKILSGIGGMLVLGLTIFSCGNAGNVEAETAQQTVAKPGESLGGSVMDVQIEQGPLDMDAYNEYVKIGDLALKDGRVQEAKMNYNLAATSNNSAEIQQKITATVNQLYKSYFDKAMDYFNEKNYLYAKKEFETARLYKNISEVNDMIEKCKAEL